MAAGAFVPFIAESSEAAAALRIGHDLAAALAEATGRGASVIERAELRRLDAHREHLAFVVALLAPEDVGAIEHEMRTARRVVALGRRALARAEAMVPRRDVVRLLEPSAGFDAIRSLAREIAGRRVGIALGAGGARGFAHIGVLEAFARAGVPIDVLVGCSVGSVVGSMWALGFDPDDIEHRLARTDRHLLRPSLGLRSLLGNGGIAAHIQRTAAGRSFSDTRMPFAVVATDLHTGEEIVVGDGPLWGAILASSSIPGLFPPVRIGERWLVDGGLSSPVPARAARALGADVVIGVTLVAPRARVAGVEPSAPNVIETVARATEIAYGRLAEASAAAATIVVAPCSTDGASGGALAFERGRRFRAMGRESAVAALPRLAEALPWIGR